MSDDVRFVSDVICNGIRLKYNYNCSKHILTILEKYEGELIIKCIE